jgi:hypothetical protein
MDQEEWKYKKHTEWLEGGELVGWAGCRRRSTAVEWRFPGGDLWERAIEQRETDCERQRDFEKRTDLFERERRTCV